MRAGGGSQGWLRAVCSIQQQCTSQSRQLRRQRGLGRVVPDRRKSFSKEKEMAAQIAGNTIGNILEVEAATHAARVTLRPEDYGALGIYLASQFERRDADVGRHRGSGSTIFSFRWGNAANLALIKRVRLSAGNGRYGVHSWCRKVRPDRGSFIFGQRYRWRVDPTFGKSEQAAYLRNGHDAAHRRSHIANRHPHRRHTHEGRAGTRLDCCRRSCDGRHSNSLTVSDIRSTPRRAPVGASAERRLCDRGDYARDRHVVLRREGRLG
jgi:hypothetical protein